MTPNQKSSDQFISIDALAAHIGTPDCRLIIDARTDDDFADDPRLIPGAERRPGLEAAAWAPEFAGREVVVYCHGGFKISQGAAAYLRNAGADAVALEGGFVTWRDAGLALVPDVAVRRDAHRRSHWVTRARPKVDRIACPWLIRRFVDRDAVFLFVEASQVLAVAERFDATPFDVDGAEWHHVGDNCTFDAMIAAWGLDADPAMARLARVVRGADTGKPELSAESAGLVAMSHGLSRLIGNDLRQLEQGMLIYDALYSWARGIEDRRGRAIGEAA